MVERQEVEALLALVEAEKGRWSPHVPAPTLAALCRAWLAVQNAPVGKYEYVVSDVAYIHFDNEGDAPSWSENRVCIVPVEGDHD